MKRSINSIHIHSEFTVYKRGEAPQRNHVIFFQRNRENETTHCKMFESNPIHDSAPRISHASVKRACRALKAFSHK